MNTVIKIKIHQTFIHDISVWSTKKREIICSHQFKNFLAVAFGYNLTVKSTSTDYLRLVRGKFPREKGL